jgi:hypothetical protein
MRTRRSLRLIVLASLLGLAGISSGLAYVGSTINTYRYAAPCGKLPGFAGLLQAAHFVPSGNCRVIGDGSCQDSAVCNISNPPSGTPTTGHCTTVTAGKTKSCVCASK